MHVYIPYIYVCIMSIIPSNLWKLQAAIFKKTFGIPIVSIVNKYIYIRITAIHYSAWDYPWHHSYILYLLDIFLEESKSQNTTHLQQHITSLNIPTPSPPLKWDHPPGSTPKQMPCQVFHVPTAAKLHQNSGETVESRLKPIPSKIEWDLTNGTLSKLLELLDTQV